MPIQSPQPLWGAGWELPAAADPIADELRRQFEELPRQQPGRIVMHDAPVSGLTCPICGCSSQS